MKTKRIHKKNPKSSDADNCEGIYMITISKMLPPVRNDRQFTPVVEYTESKYRKEQRNIL